MQTYILALIVSVGKCIFFIGRFLIKENWFLFFLGGGAYTFNYSGGLLLRAS